MEIRAKITLAVDSFKQGIKSAADSYSKFGTDVKAVDKYIADSGKSSNAARRAYSEQSANGQIAQIRKVEQAAIESNRKVQKAYTQVKPGALPLDLVQKSSRSTVNINSNTSGLPERKTAEYRYELEMKIAKLRQQADEASRRAAEAGLKIALTEAEYKKRGYKAGKPVGMEENLLNLFGKDLSKDSAKTAASIQRELAKLEQVRAAYNQKELDRIAKQEAAAVKAQQKISDAETARWAQARKVVKFKSPEFERSMASTRYALYDIGTKAMAMGVAIEGALVAAVAQSAKFESAFTSVERTTGVTGEQVGELKKALLDLSTTVPVTFDQIARIATLGAQMGIAADSVDDFAETISKFASITGIEVDTVAQSFGRLSQMLDVPVSKFENLSSALAYTGVNAVATDREIITMAESIAVAGSQAGLSTDEVIGFSSALASLKVRPEEARGVITRLFREIDIEAGKGGTAIADFGKVMGITADATGSIAEKTSQLWKQNPAQFVQSFLSGANAAGNLNAVIESLGITNTRELRVIQSLANNNDVLAKSLADAKEQYLLGTYSADAYAKVQDDLVSKVTMLQSAFEEMAASFGDVFNNEALKGFIDFIKGTIKAITDMPAGIKAVIALFALVVAGMTLWTATMALSIAGLLALKLALKNLGDSTIKASLGIGTLKALLRSLTGDASMAAGALHLMGFGAKGASVSVAGLTVSMRGLMAAMGVIGVIVTAVSIFAAFADGAARAKDEQLKLGEAAISAAGGMDVFIKALRADTDAYNEAIAKGEEVGYTHRKISIALNEEAKEREANKNAVLAEAEAHLNASQTIGSAADAVKDNATANDILTASLLARKEAQEGATGATETDTAIVGTNTKKLLFDSLRSYAKDNGETGDFIAEAVTQSPQQLAVAKAFGYDYMKMVDAGIREAGGALDFTSSIGDKIKPFLLQLNTAVKDTMLTDTPASLQTLIQNVGTQMGLQEPTINKLKEAYSGLKVSQAAALDPRLPENFYQVSKSIDSQTAAVQANLQANDEAANSWQNAGNDVSELGEDAQSTSEMLNDMVNGLNSVERANGKAKGSFKTLQSGLKGVKGQLTTSADSLENWATFMQDAAAAATADGTDAVGTITRMAAAIKVLGDNGSNTEVQVQNLLTMISSTYTGSQYDALIAKMSTKTTLSGMIQVIDSYITLAKLVPGTSAAVIKSYEDMKAALSGGEFTSDFAKGLGTVTTSAGTAKTALEKLQDAIEKVFKSRNARIELEAALDSLNASLRDGGKSFSVYTEAGRSNLTNLQGIIDSLAVSSGGNMQTMANSLASLKQAMISAGITSSAAMGMIDAAMKATGKTGQYSLTQVQNLFNGLTGTIAQAAKKTKKSLRDWASDVESVISAAFENRYGKTTALDAITTAWDEMAKSAADAAKKVEDARKTIAGLSADKNILEYQLQIAIKYGDTLRADAIRAELAQKKTAIADEQAKIAEAQAESSTELKGNTAAAIKNRTTMRGLVQGYNEYLLSMAATGASNDELNAKAKELAAEFLAQGKAMGFAEADLKEYTTAFEGDFATVIKNLPKDVTLKLNSTDPVITAIADFVTKANEELAKITIIDLNGNPITGIDSGATPAPVKKAVPTAAEIKSYKWGKKVINGPYTYPAKEALARKRILDFEAKYGKGYKDGGLITGEGTGTSDSIPAMLSNGEFVVKASAVTKYGPDFMNALNQMKISVPRYSGGGASFSGGSSVVYLSPEDRSLLRAAIDRPIALYTENTKIAQSANAGNVILAQRGSN